MSRHSDITVVIPCFNHGRFLLESVERALGQNGGPPKVIVVDDGSTDAETEAALDALPAGVELIRQQNSGVAVARNAGFENSDSELLLMVDADDRLTVGRHWAYSESGAEQLDAPGAMESGPDGGKGPFGRVRGGNQPVRGDLAKIEVLSVDHGADQTGRGAEPEQRRRRRFERDAHAERRAQRGRGNSGR